MKPYCLQPSAAVDSQCVYEGNLAWPACPIGYLRPAFAIELDHGHGAYIMFDSLDRPYSGTSPEAALDAFTNRPMTRAALG